MDGITGGYVLFGKTVKTGDYENEKSEIRLDFNDPKAFDEAGEKAKEKALDLLGKGVIKRRGPGRPPSVVKPPVIDTSDVVAEPVVEAPVAVPVVQPTPVADPAALTEDWEPKTETAAPIMDKDMVAMFSRKVAAAENKNGMATKIKEVIATYVKLPSTAKDIPFSQRAEFMAKIEAL